MPKHQRTAYGGSINVERRADAKTAAPDAEAAARAAMQERTRRAHEQPTGDGVRAVDVKRDEGETLNRGRPLENAYTSTGLDEVRAQIAMAARTANQWIQDPVERDRAIAKYIANAERRTGGTK